MLNRLIKDSSSLRPGRWVDSVSSMGASCREVVCACGCSRAHLCACLHVCACGCVCTRAHLCVYLHVCVHVGLGMCTHVLRCWFQGKALLFAEILTQKLKQTHMPIPVDTLSRNKFPRSHSTRVSHGRGILGPDWSWSLATVTFIPTSFCPQMLPFVLNKQDECLEAGSGGCLKKVIASLWSDT